MMTLNSFLARLLTILRSPALIAMGENREATLPAWDDIEHILKIGGTAGASIGIVHHGKILARRSFGYQDV